MSLCWYNDEFTSLLVWTDAIKTAHQAINNRIYQALITATLYTNLFMMRLELGRAITCMITICTLHLTLRWICYEDRGRFWTVRPDMQNVLVNGRTIILSTFPVVRGFV